MPDITTIHKDEQSVSGYRLEDIEVDGIPTDGLGWLKPFPADVGDDILREELDTKGVVHVRGVMPRDLVLEMRRKWFEHTAPSGILAPGTKAIDGIYSGLDPDQFVGPDNAAYLAGKPNQGLYYKLSAEGTVSPWAQDFADNEYLLQMVHRLQPHWTTPMIFRRQLYRANVPNATKTTTGVHYDQIFLRGGPATSLTAWLPIGDCSPVQGGLMYLEDSKSLGEELEREFTNKARQGGLTDGETRSAFNQNMIPTGMVTEDLAQFTKERGEGRKWLIGDFQAGDAIFHHSYMIHAGGVNRDPKNRIRLSGDLDLRFADRDAPHEERWSDPWRADDGL